MKRTRFSGTILALPLLLALSLPMACSRTDSEAVAESATPPASGSQIPTGRFVGNVVETMDAGTYTYVALEREGERVWAAGPKTAVTIGQEIAISLDMQMEDFESDTLGRRFETIYFVDALGGSEPAADPHAGLARSKAGAEDAPIDLGSIDRPDGGYLVAELWDQRRELTGKEVVVRGRVVKYNGGIMGRNWLHIQDGSGDPGTGSHDLTVTAEGPSKVGDLVTIRGVVAVDQDFGAGYRYELLVENATVEIE